MSIKEAAFKVGAMYVDKDTKLSEFRCQTPFMVSGSSTDGEGTAWAAEPGITFLGMQCRAQAFFHHGRIGEIRLVPCTDYKGPSLYEKERRRELAYARTSSEMKAEYGKPDKETYGSIFYGFPGGTMTAMMEEDGAGGDGFVSIRFTE